MRTITRLTASAALAAALALPATAQAQVQTDDRYANAATDRILVEGNLPADLEGLPAGPDLDGFISARAGNRMQVTTEAGAQEVVGISQATDIKAKGGFLGMGRDAMTPASLLNGLPVSVETVRWEGGLVASKVRFSDSKYETAAMIARGTAQGFAEQTAATEALRGRVADIDNYLVRDTTNVYFDTGEWGISPQAGAELCNAAAQAEGMDNALLLVVGYTDSVGDQDYNQVLSDRRASRVVNYLQQECGWQPWRMLTPTGMAEADPAADNMTATGKAQNRRVAVNVLVSKAVDGI